MKKSINNYIPMVSIKMYNFRKNDSGKYVYSREQFTYRTDSNNRFHTDVYAYDSCSIDDFVGLNTVTNVIRKKYKFSLDVYENLKQKSKGIFDNVYYEMRKSIKQEEHITMGDSSDEDVETKWLVESGTSFIDLEGKQILEVLDGQKHPMLVGTKLLKTPQTKKICDLIIQKLESHASVWGGDLASYDYKKIEIIKDFIKENEL